MNEKDLEDVVFYLEECRGAKKTIENREDPVEQFAGMFVHLQEVLNKRLGISDDDKKGSDER